MPLTRANSKTSPLVVVDNLHVRFQTTGTTQSEPVKGVSFEIAQGEMLAFERTDCQCPTLECR